MVDTDAVEQDVPITLTRAKYEEKLVQYNRRLASIKSECNRLEMIDDEAEVAYERARERRHNVFGEFGRRIYEQEVWVDASETEKHRLNVLIAAHQVSWDEVYERRQAQYDRALIGLTSNKALKEGKWVAMGETRRHRTHLMDIITSVSKQIDYLKERHRESLYAVSQSMVCRKVNLTYEQDKEIQNIFEIIIINHKCNQNDLIQKITKYYDTIKEMINSQKQDSKIKKELKKLITKYEDKEIDIILQNDEIVMLISLQNSLDKKINNLTKQIKVMRKELNVKINTNKKIMIEENLKYIQPVKIFENDTKTNDSLNDLQQDVLVANEIRKQKCIYVKKIIDEIVNISHEIKKYLTGEKQLMNNPENIDWLLNMIRPLIHNIKTIKTIYACNDRK